MTQRTIDAMTTSGKVRGLVEDGAAVFRAIPYAAPPVGPLRFRPPAPSPAWRDVRDATRPGPLPPQTPSRLARVLGDYDLDYAEDCLHLNVATPAVDGAARPVLVWLHGGAFLTGGNAIAWYDGSAFARHHDIVFVGVNYRLGILGFHNVADLGPSNLGLHDQHAALAWVRANIAHFGGDPEQVTVVGQSAGAISALALLANSEASTLFHRAVFQSGRLASLASLDAARADGQAILDHAGLSARAVHELPLAQLLALQSEHIRSHAVFGKTMTAFRPCADGEFVPLDTLDAAQAQARGKAVMIGWTRDEMAAFFAGNADVLDASPEAIEGVLEAEWGANWRDGMAFARARQPGASQDRFLDLAINECMFAGSSVTFAERLAATCPTWVYRFDWAAPGNPFGACHCIELPFVFGNADTWAPPMLEGADPSAVTALSAAVQSAWAAFIRDGDPNHDRLPPWPRYDVERRWTLRIDSVVETVGDLAGLGLPGRAVPRSLYGVKS